MNINVIVIDELVIYHKDQPRKIHRMTVYTHLLQQRRKTEIFAHE